jgi:hypothetical protein
MRITQGLISEIFWVSMYPAVSVFGSLILYRLNLSYKTQRHVSVCEQHASGRAGKGASEVDFG